MEPSNEPRALVCSRCWFSFFSSPEFKGIGRIQHESAPLEYKVTVSELKQSANAGCNWCSLILSNKEYVEDLTLEDGQPPLNELTVGFGSVPRMITEAFTPNGYNRFGLWINGASNYLTAFTTCDDPVAQLVTAREIDNRVDSARAYNQIQEWLKQCSGHRECSNPEQRILPSRVIEVSPEQNTESPRLFVTNGLKGSYAALSYCWGRNQVGITTRKNINERRSQLGVKSLSRSVQDAIVVTKRVGLNYLWVDAICIIQDDADDIVAELAKMGDIYRHAQITIVAASAKESGGGFLEDRSDPSPSTKIPFWSSNRLGTVNIRVEGWYNDDEEPVNTRAWTLQERLLSPRLLLYGTNTLQYQCQEHTVNLGNSIHIPSGLTSWRLPSSYLHLGRTMVSGAAEIQSASRTWAYIISMYSQRQLTKITDKLIALAGIAELFHAKLRTKYLAGLWSGDFLPRLLLWEASQTTRYLPCSAYIAPSWSWASLESPVQYSTLYADHKFEWFSVQNLIAETTPSVLTLPFAAVTGGCIVFSARTRLGVFKPPQSIQWNTTRGSNKLASAGYSPARIYLDDWIMKERCVTCVAITKRTYEPNLQDEHDKRLAEVAFPSPSSRCGGIWTAVDGLIVEVSGGNGLYRRIGCFFGTDETEFLDCPSQTITMI